LDEPPLVQAGGSSFHYGAYDLDELNYIQSSVRFTFFSYAQPREAVGSIVKTKRAYSRPHWGANMLGLDTLPVSQR